AVMAVWGAPVAREDDAERAVRAALELVDAVTPLGVTARAGVLTGEAAVNVGAIGEGMVVGDIVNTAARLQSVAAPGTVLVGESTYRAASRAIAFEPAGDQALKGKTAAVRAWLALRVTAERGGRNRNEGLEAPFVGRADELRLLKDLFHATERERRIRLVSVMGPAGIGKTRLAREFLKYIDGLVETVYWHEGRSPAYGEGISFWALGEMVRSRAGLAEADDETTTRAKVREVIASWVPDEEERRWIEPALLTLLGIGGGTIASDELFAAWRTFFERLAAQAPVVMVFEDFHFADPGLLDFVDHLQEWSKGMPLYVVTLARPELLEKRTDWGAGKRSFTSLYLEPLGERAMRDLIEGLVPGLPDVATGAIIGRADGIPPYAIEIVRMLVADGRLVPADGVFRPVGDLTTLAVPETLIALIASRLDALDRSDRDLVSDGAVLGQSFTFPALAAVSGTPEPDLERRVQGLVRREILRVEADPRSPERGQYVFVQALIREVAYNTLSKRERKSRHVASARYFEGLGSDELAGALAGHYLAAYQNATAGPEADALAAQARIALKAAADRAVTLGAHEQAVAFLRQALSVTFEPADEGDVLERVGEAADAAGRHEAAEAYLRQAIERYGALGDRVGAARSTAALGHTLSSGRRAEVALPILEGASAEFANIAGDPALVMLRNQLARAYFLGTSDYRRAVETADDVLEAAERANLLPVVADALVTKGGSLAFIGRRIEGLALMRAGQELAGIHGPAEAMLRSAGNQAALMGASNPRVGLMVGRTGIAAARRLGRRSQLAFITGVTAWAALFSGEWDWAVAELESLLADDLDASDRAEALGPASVLAGYRGEDFSARLAEFEQLATDRTDPQIISGLLDARRALAVSEARFRDAHEITLREVEVLGTPEFLMWSARYALWAGDDIGYRADIDRVDAAGIYGGAYDAERIAMRAAVAALDGHQADAVVLYRDAMRLYRELGAIWSEALCAIDMATVLDPSEPNVEATAATARETFSRLRAKPFLDELETRMGRRGDGIERVANQRSTHETTAPVASGDP
ncbi:MAG TPA: AAA family ATPase, partial [Candidatus Limnocylindrales bacterium]